MFPNLNAEQARRGMKDEDVAGRIGISRVSYGAKKKNGGFTISEANFLCDLFKCQYSYLFGEEIYVPTRWEREKEIEI